MKKRGKSRNFPWVMILILTAFIAGTSLWFYHSWKKSRNIQQDESWPYHDMTSGSYSSGYDGIDISRHNGRIHWDELEKNKHIKFIYVKASEGLMHKDPCYDINISEARKHGFKVGSYHFMAKGGTGTMQFANFSRTIDYNKQDILPMIDVEDDGTKGWSKEGIQEHLRDFIEACQKTYGVAPVIYCSESYYKDYLSPEFDNYILFIANYNHRPVLPGDPKYDIWQFSRKGRIPGIWTWVDLDRFAPGFRVEDITIKR